MKGKFSNQVAKELAEQGGIGIRYGCHCSHMLVKSLLKVSPGLERFQRLIATLFHKVNFPGLARISMGIGNSEEDVDTLIHVLGKIARRTRVLPKVDVKQQMKDFARAAEKKVYSQL